MNFNQDLKPKVMKKYLRIFLKGMKSEIFSKKRNLEMTAKLNGNITN